MEAVISLNIERKLEKTVECEAVDGKRAILDSITLNVFCKIDCIYGLEKDNGYCIYDGHVPVRFRENSE